MKAINEKTESAGGVRLERCEGCSRQAAEPRRQGSPRHRRGQRDTHLSAGGAIHVPYLRHTIFFIRRSVVCNALHNACSADVPVPRRWRSIISSFVTHGAVGYPLVAPRALLAVEFGSRNVASDESINENRLRGTLQKLLRF